MKHGPAKAIAPERVRGEWLRRVEAEYRSAAITQHLTLWLIQMGASPDLIAAGLRIVRDELAHASLSHRTYVAAGGSDAPRMARESLELPRRPRDPLEFDVSRTCLEVFCLGETVAVRLFKELRERCKVPVARHALDRVLRDEVRHRDFGWLLLDALLASPMEREIRELIVRELPRAFVRIRQMYAPFDSTKPTNLGVAAERERPLDASETAWGLMPAARYGELLRRTFERDYVPRFARAGIDARAAWT
jgi:hypothetical protein